MNVYNLYLKFKIGLIVVSIIIHILFFLFFPTEISKIVSITINKTLIELVNLKIRVHGNTNNFQNNKLLIMSNHYDGFLDGNTIFKLYYKYNSIEMLHTIVKADILGDPTSNQKSIKFLSFIKNEFINSSYFIPYKRGDKEDGKQTKNIIVEYLNKGKNILVFPEGTTHRDGIPKDFKNGIFELAVENKLRILPITVKYEKDIGAEKGEPVKLLKLFDNVVDIYIHDVIDETDECYINNDFMALKQKTINLISKPMISSIAA
jgi:1-acyl-sn-glycerol-3-phosphate acyltransferase